MRLNNLNSLKSENEKSESNLNVLFNIPKRLIVAILTSFGLLILTVIQTNFAITNSLILNPHDSKDIPVDDDQLPNTVCENVKIKNVFNNLFV
jgi:hypothetical protein